MKHIRLYKLSSTPNINHVYEHIFVTSLWKFFEIHKLFNGIDYSYTATSFDDGLICVDLELFGAKAMNLEKQIYKIKPYIDYDSIKKAVVEVCTENEQQLLDDTDISEKLLTTICLIDKIEWNTTEELSILDLHRPRISRKDDVQFKDINTRNYSNALISINIDKDFAKSNRPLLPLFKIVTRSLIMRLGFELLPDALGWYAYDYTDDKHSVYVHIHTLKQESVSMEACLELCREYLKQYITDDFLSDLSKRLVDISTEDDLCIDNAGLYEHNDILIGKQYFKDLNLVDVCDDIFKHSLLAVNYRNKKGQIELSRLTNTKPTNTLTKGV